MKQKLILAIDFDNTICYHFYPKIGDPIPGAFETLRKFIQDGHRLILWTCREGVYLDHAIEFCKQNGVEFEAHNCNVLEHDYMKSRKPYSDLYIDDRMVGGFPGWLVVEEYVNKMADQWQ